MRPNCLLAILIALSVSLFGCSGDTYLSGPGVTLDDLYPEFASATLEIHSPVSADILFLDELVVLDAEVLDADGLPLEFDEIAWEIEESFEPLYVGAYGELEMDHGIYEFTATAELPNGDRLQSTIGGVRIQGRHTGIYSGNFQINIDADFQGTPITASCLGGLDFVIDMNGETISGEDGSCTINLFIMGEFEVGYALDGEVGDDDVAGDVQLDMGLFDLPVGYEGEIDDGELFAGFDGSAILFDFYGEIDAHRVSLYVDE